MDSDLAIWVNDIREASKLPARQRATKPDQVVQSFCEHAFEHGLEPSVVDDVVQIIVTKGHLDQACLSALVKSLYPQTTVSDQVVYQVIGCLGNGIHKPNATVQNGLLRWLIMIYESLETPTLLSKFYSVLFNLLDMIGLRSTLCHLLSLITRRKHVRPYRIQMLLELARIVGNEPPLVGLIRVYKDYYPDIIVQDTTRGRATLFQHPNKAWGERLSEIQRKYSDDIPPGTEIQSSFKVARRTVNGARGGKSSVLPDVHTSLAVESSTTLEEIENVDDFVRNLDRIELPNQIVSTLKDPLLQKFLELKPSDVAARRLDNWLSTFFREELSSLFENQTKNARMTEVLLSLVRYTQRTKSFLVPSTQQFLRVFLPSWNGIIYKAEILALTSLLPLGSFGALYQEYLMHVESAILDNSLQSKQNLLAFYTSLLRHWIKSLLDARSVKDAESMEGLNQLINHVDLLCLSILDTPDCPFDVISTVTFFWEVVSAGLDQSREQPYFRITTPSSSLVYMLFFTSSLSILSRLCNILVVYKKAFETAIAPSASNPGRAEYPRTYVNHFNGYLMDICNCIWRNRAFNFEDSNALACMVPKSILPALRQHADQTGHTLPTLFSLSFSNVLCALSIACFREIEDAADDIEARHAGPVTQRSLSILKSEGGVNVSWAAYRIEVLRWLEEQGVDGVSNLMYNTMKHLLNPKGRESIGARRVSGGTPRGSVDTPP